ncbi:NUDIX hydrolase [Oceanivirga salmonicida]|uniref:NUDIX hydrolase n=1 Tax=Oceanivirga salmonicida TaxID=1769291 RepID=UPI00082D9D48|nr:NUDIX hydrolase [Oceanivirga salmonicida]
MNYHIQNGGKIKKGATIMGEEFKFLKGKIKKHPTRNVNLEYLERIDAVCVAVFDNSMEYIYLVKQYRAGSDDNMLEIVAGLIDDGEKPLDAMYRELAEETGFYTDDIEKMVKMPNYQYVTPGYSTEKLYFYAVRLKKDAVAKKQNLDDGEDIEVVKVKVDEVLSSTYDMKTSLAIKYFKNFD